MKPPTYTPLSYSSREIRLVTVQPSSEKSAPIECSTTTVSLDQAPKYYALSYCWGDLGIADRISLNHAEVPVTENLGVALRYFRTALADLRDKNQHVRL
jgi:hypothetical protein